MLNMAKVKKKKKQFLCQKHTYGFFTSFGKVFFFVLFIMSLHDVTKGGTPYMCISPGRVHPRTH